MTTSAPSQPTTTSIPTHSDAETRQSEKCPHAEIVGTEGDDVLQGTSKGETICGLGGDDVIYSNGGDKHVGDSIYAGAGADTIIGSRNCEDMRGGPGDDVLRSGGSEGEIFVRCSADSMDGGPGDDVLLGAMPSMGDHMDGGKGNDVLVPAPIRVIENRVDAGPGNDVVVTLNFMHDSVDLDGLPQISAGIAGVCSVTVPMVKHDKKPHGTFSCELPWPKQLTGLGNVVNVEGSINQDGDVSLSGDLFSGMAEISTHSWREIARGQVDLTSDVCICDPLVKVGEVPEFPLRPWDSSS
ncbi:MAG: calcium-binding protein [Nocardioidaceae bacterium]